MFEMYISFLGLHLIAEAFESVGPLHFFQKLKSRRDVLSYISKWYCQKSTYFRWVL